MPALVSYWEGAIFHFPLNQYRSSNAVPKEPDRSKLKVWVACHTSGQCNDTIQPLGVAIFSGCDVGTPVDGTTSKAWSCLASYFSRRFPNSSDGG